MVQISYEDKMRQIPKHKLRYLLFIFFSLKKLYSKGCIMQIDFKTCKDITPIDVPINYQNLLTFQFGRKRVLSLKVFSIAGHLGRLIK